MADNVNANSGDGLGPVLATDDVAGVHYGISKITIGALDSAGTLLSGGNGAVDAGTVRVTVASDSTGVLSVDDNGGSLTVDATALDIRALTNADVVTAELSATDNAVLDAIAASVAGTLTVGAHAVTLATLPDTAAGDLAAINASLAGSLTVGTHAVTGPLTDTELRATPVPVSGTVTANLSATDNAVLDTLVAGQLADGHNVTVDNASIAVTGPVTDTELRATPVPVSGTVSITGGGDATAANQATLIAGQLPDGHNVTVDNASIAVTGPVTDTELRATPVVVDLGANNDVTVTGTVTANAGTGTQAVSLASVPSHAVTNAGTFVVQVDGAALTALQLLDDSSVAHDAAAVAGVSQIGLEARNTEPTAVGTTGDATRALGTMLGKQVGIPYAIPGSTWQYAAVSGGITDTADDVAKAAGGAGIRNYITSVQVINGHATVGTEVVIKDGSTVIWRGHAEPTGGGVSAKFDPPLRGTANTAVNVANITTGSKTYFNLQGFVAAE